MIERVMDFLWCVLGWIRGASQKDRLFTTNSLPIISKLSKLFTFFCTSSKRTRPWLAYMGVRLAHSAEYGITLYKTGDYEVDHLIPLSLGGSNSIRNLWPRSTKTSPWNSYVKEVLEWKLHNLVCAGKVDLKTAHSQPP